MIQEFSVHPKASNNKARVFFIVCLITAAALFAVSLFINAYKGVVGVIATAFLVAAVFLFTKYLAPKYSYDITYDSAELPVFVVRQITGKRQTTLCRIDLHSITNVEHETADERSKHKTPFGYVKYAYVPTLAPESTYRVTSFSRYEKAEIIIECSEDFANLLLSYAAEAKELHDIKEAEEEF